MAINLSDMLKPERKQLIRDMAKDLDDTIPAIQQMVDEGLPMDMHLAKYQGKREWVRKFERLFLSPTTTDS